MNKGTLKTIKGDVTTPQFSSENEIAIIPHVCNDCGIMGAGVAFALSRKWPKILPTYKAITTAPSNKVLGLVDYVKVEDNIYVFNMIAQKGFRSKNNSRPLRYVALIEAMKYVVGQLNFLKMQDDRKIVIHTPKFGSDLSGGNFSFILDLIDEIWLDAGYDVVVYEFE